jgi:uncharacterized protein YmfQ (DUF2313 family)
MGMSSAQYRDQLIALQPPGAALPVEPDSRWGRLLHALAEELARLDARAEDLRAEADPRTTSELLIDWERLAGLPDVCSLADETAEERRGAVHARIVSIGGQRAQYYIDIASALGFTVTVHEFRPFKAGLSQAGDPLTNGDWAWAWEVRAAGVTAQFFRAGLSQAGDPLRLWGREALLECAIARYAPAHTHVLFSYLQ